MSSDRKIRVAIVGSASAPSSSPSTSTIPNAEMYAICRRDRKELDACGDRFGVKTRYTDYDELLKDPNVDAVHINSPDPRPRAADASRR